MAGQQYYNDLSMRLANHIIKTYFTPKKESEDVVAEKDIQSVLLIPEQLDIDNSYDVETFYNNVYITIF